TGYTSAGNIATVGYNTNGNPLWDPIIYNCGEGIDIASKMIMDDCNNIFITGYSNCNGTFQDVRTIKYSPFSATITASGPIIFCEGDSVTLNASPATTYLWSNGANSQSITVSASGDYSVTVTNSNDCSAISSITTVNVDPMPIVEVNSPTICDGQYVT